MPKKYKDTNDYELLYLVSENNQDAKDLFFEKYENIIRIKASKYKNIAEAKGFDFNDLIQEGMLGLTQAINSFQEQKDTTFYTFANICIDRQLATFIRNIDREKHRVLNESISLDTTTNSVGRPINEILLDKNNIDPLLSLEKYDYEEDIINKLLSILSNQEKEVFNLRTKGYSYKEIAEELNLSKKSVDKCMERIKTKIEKVTKEE